MIFNQSCWTLSGPQQYVYSIHPWEIWINNFTAGCILEHPGLHVYYSTISYTIQLMVVFCKTQDYMYTILLYPTLYSWWLYFGTPRITILLYSTLYSWWLYFGTPWIILFYCILHYTALWLTFPILCHNGQFLLASIFPISIYIFLFNSISTYLFMCLSIYLYSNTSTYLYWTSVANIVKT